MSHLKERKEKICLNCNAQLQGPFCHICGQENIEPKESAWHLVTHFFNDVTHFDGKFFNTLGLLIRRPGFLPREYMLGRRASYLNPIRMYIFTSAVFFLVFFSIFHVSDNEIDGNVRVNGKTLKEMQGMPADSLAIFTAKHNNGKAVPRQEVEKYFDSVRNSEGFRLDGNKYSSRHQYDSLLKKGVLKDNWLKRTFIHKQMEADEKYHHSFNLFISAFLSTFLHSFPQMLIISLPIFAFILKLLYWRRKEYYYVSHGIFSIHFYIFVFITLLFIFGLGEIRDALLWQWLNYLRGLLTAAIFFYGYKAMRNFYQQRRIKTIVKFLLLYILSVIMIGFLSFVFILFSFMKI